MTTQNARTRQAVLAGVLGVSAVLLGLAAAHVHRQEVFPYLGMNGAWECDGDRTKIAISEMQKRRLGSPNDLWLEGIRVKEGDWFSNGYKCVAELKGMDERRRAMVGPASYVHYETWVGEDGKQYIRGSLGGPD